MISVRGAREHNLRDVDLDLPRDRLVVFTGLSGSGKSSLAFDTIYAEGQRRYVESLSSYARQFLGQMDKPDVDFIEGLSPAISIDQKSAIAQPALDRRHDHRDLRLPAPALRAHRHPALPEVRPASSPARRRSRSSTGCCSCPRARASRCSRRSCAAARASTRACSPSSPKQGFTRARIDGEIVELADRTKDRLARYENHTIEVVVDRLVRRPGIERRLTDSLETALRLAEGVAEVEIVPEGRRRGRRARDAHVLRAPRVHALRAVVRRARAAQLLVQLAVRRVRALRRARHAVRGRPGADRRRRRPLDRRRRDRAVERVPGRVLQPGARRGRRRVRLLRVETPWKKLTKAQQKVVLYGAGKTQVLVRYKNRYGRKREYKTRVRRRDPVARAPLHRGRQRPQRGSRSRATCARCRARVRRRAPAARVARRSRSADKNISEVGNLSIRKTAAFFAEIELNERERLIAERVLKEVNERLRFLLDVGLDYLTLNRIVGHARRRRGAAHPARAARSAAGSSACSTCSTSRRSASTSATTSASSTRWCGCATSATP